MNLMASVACATSRRPVTLRGADADIVFAYHTLKFQTYQSFNTYTLLVHFICTIFMRKLNLRDFLVKVVTRSRYAMKNPRTRIFLR